MGELNRVRALVEFTPGLRATEITSDVLTAAAAVRARTRLKLPDALVVGSAMANRSEAIIGNDSAFQRLRSLGEVPVIGTSRAYRIPEYIHIDDYLDEN
jgi:hypothetical protein